MSVIIGILLSILFDIRCSLERAMGSKEDVLLQSCGKMCSLSDLSEHFFFPFAVNFISVQMIRLAAAFDIQRGTKNTLVLCLSLSTSSLLVVPVS